MQSKIYIRNTGGEPLSVGDDGRSVTSLHMAYISGDPIVAGIDQEAVHHMQLVQPSQCRHMM